MRALAGVHHVDLVVSSIERSLPFYRDLLAPLGYHRISEVEGERGETIWYLGGPSCAPGLREAQAAGEHDRYRVGIHHIALTRGREASSTNGRNGSPPTAPRSRAV